MTAIAASIFSMGLKDESNPTEVSGRALQLWFSFCFLRYPMDKILTCNSSKNNYYEFICYIETSKFLQAGTRETHKEIY